MAEETSFSFDTFPEARYHPQWHLVCFRPTGVLDAAMMERVAQFAGMHEEVGIESFHRYTDLTALTDVQIKMGQLFDFAARRQEATAAIDPVKSAIYAESVLGFGIAHMYETLMEGAQVKVKAFNNPIDAAAWLGIPSDILYEQAGTKSDDRGGRLPAG